MLRDNLVGLIEPMLSSAEAYPLALYTARQKPSDDRTLCLKNPRPEGAESTLTENAASPFHAEPKQALDETAQRGEGVLKELVAEPEHFVNALGLDCLAVERAKGVRFSILPFKTATLANSCVAIVPVVHYLRSEE